MGGTSSRGQRFLHHWRLQCGAGVAVGDLGTYKEHFIAHIFLMRTVCQVVLSGSHPSLTFHALALLKMKLCACVHFPKQFILRATCRTLHQSGPGPFHLAPALLPILRHDLPQLPRLSILARSTLATIQNKRVPAVWLMYAPLQVMSPRILQKTMDLCVKPLFFHRPRITSTCDFC